MNSSSKPDLDAVDTVGAAALPGAGAHPWSPAGRVLARVAPALSGLLFTAWLFWAAFVHCPGLHDNDWPLLMWLVKHATLADPSPLAIGHYGPAQLLLAWWLHPVFDSTLVVAKLLSIAGAVGSAACLYLMARRDHGEAAGLLGAAAFALSASALLTGQSEFADAPAGAVFLWGIYLWWRSGERRGLLAGVLLGSAGLMRTHFVFFSLATAGLAALLGAAWPLAGSSRREAVRAGALLLLGAVLGNLPGFLLNLRVHGQLGSAVAHTFIGQVLYGVDEFDFLNTYDQHPLGEILRDRPMDLVRLMYRRVRAEPALWATPLLALALALWKRRSWPPAVLRHVVFIGLLAFAYFWLFVALAWWVSPRLIFTITALECWLAAAVVTQLFWGTVRHGRALSCGVFALLIALRWPGEASTVRALWQRSNGWWETSTELTQRLRALGMKDAREAFVFDWNRFVVDDPELQPFYNFGFWNLLVPEFRDERPIPTPYLNNLRRLSAFFQDQGVRFFVVPHELRLVRRFPALAALVEGRRQLPQFRREAELGRDVLFLLED